MSWTTHDLLALDRDRWSEYDRTQKTLNGALAHVLDAFGFHVAPFGCGGAHIVTGSRAGPPHENSPGVLG